uniref:H2A.Z variant histone 2a n=1 Tax=Seriola dumerili TaxID=41447 RepID=A0A3B4VAJ4_SERDU
MKNLKADRLKAPRSVFYLPAGVGGWCKAGKDSGKAKAKAVSRLPEGWFCSGSYPQALETRTTSHGRVGATAAVYTSRISHHVLDWRGNASKDLKVKSWTPLIKATIAGGGVIPHIHKSPSLGRRPAETAYRCHVDQKFRGLGLDRTRSSHCLFYY